MKHPDQPNYAVGIVGCGAMGQGIAQVSAQGGLRTLLFDARDGGAAAAKETIAGRIDRMAEKGRVTEADAAAAIERLEIIDALAGLAPADAVIEAIFENIEAKQALFTELEAVLRPDALIASNTSSIPIASIARGCAHRGRIGGLHFFYPVPLMKLVEVIRAAETSDETVVALMALGRRMTRVPVEVKDSPGFLVNLGGRAYTTEALRIVHEGVATPAQVDAIMRDCWGFRMGPFELMDLTGIDVNYPVSQIIYEGYNQDPRLKTSPNHKAMFDAGLFGRKTGQGWYRYDEKGQMIDPPSADLNTKARPATKVALATSLEDPTGGLFEAMLAGAGSGGLLEDFRAEEALYAFCHEIGIEVIEDDGKCPIISAPHGRDTAHTSHSTGAPHKRLVCVDLLGNWSKRVTLMTAPGAETAVRNRLAAAITRLGRPVTAIADSPGFVGQRMVAMIANLGCYMAEIGLASPKDIDTAMELGLNYPGGSIALGEVIGAEVCDEILMYLKQITGDDRYRAALWLKRRALLGLSLYTPN